MEDIYFPFEHEKVDPHQTPYLDPYLDLAACIEGGGGDSQSASLPLPDRETPLPTYNLSQIIAEGGGPGSPGPLQTYELNL